MEMRCIIICLLILCRIEFVIAQNESFIIQGEKTEYTHLNTYVSVWKETDKNTTITKVIEKKTLQEFTPYQLPYRADSVYWFEISFKNKQEVAQSFILNLGRRVFLGEVEVYVQHGDSLVLPPQKTGWFVPSSQKKINQGRETAIRLSLSARQITTIYARVQNKHGYSFRLDLKLQRVPGWNEMIQQRNLIQGFFHGLLWIMILYNFLIFLQTRDKVYGYYALYMSSTSLYLLFFQSYTLELFLGEYPRANIYLMLVGLTMGIVSYLQFMRLFLNTTSLWGSWDRVIQYVIYYKLITGVLAALYFAATGNFRVLDGWNTLSVVLESVFILITLYFLMQTNNKLAHYFILGSLGLWVGILLGGIGHWSRWSMPPLYFAQVGIGVEVLLFSLGLGYRIRLNEREKEKVQKEWIAQLEENAILLKEQQKLKEDANQELEKQVQKRILEIEQQKEELQNLNDLKNRLFTIIAHDFRSPLSYIQNLMSFIQYKEPTPEKLNIYMEDLAQKANFSMNMLDNLLVWAKSQMGGLEQRNTQMDMHLIVQEKFDLLANETKEKDISLKNLVKKGTLAYGEFNMVDILVRNLITNAIKFTEDGGNISVSAKVNGNYIKMAVKDTGVGMSEEVQQNIFKKNYTSLGTRRERGSGLGLMICKEFVEKSGGEIWVESKEGIGTTFFFTLPRKQENE